MSDRWNERVNKKNRSSAFERGKTESVPEQRNVYPKNDFGQELLTEDLEVVLSTDEGRRVIWHILEESTILEGDFDLTNSRAFIVSGKESIGHILWKVISGKLSYLLTQLQIDIKRDKASLKNQLEFRKGKED